MRRFILISLFATIGLLTTHCTSKNSENLDAPPAEDSLSLDGDPAASTDANASAAPPAEGAAPADPASGNLDETQAGFLDDQLLNEDPTQAPPPADPNALAAQDPTQVPPPADQQPPSELPAPDVVAGVDPGAEAATPPAADALPAVVVEPPKEEPPKEEAPVVAEAPKPVAPLRKVEATPFRRNGMLLNSVYLARPGDNYNKISEMIYGDASHVKDLKKANPSIKKPKPGDKIYYNSPVRPTDETHIANFYEDKGIPAQTYVAQDGDNIRKVSKNLLGYDQAWREVWATNGVESKGSLSAGTELKYWPKESLTVAQAPPPPMEQQLPPAPPVQELPPAPPVQDLPPPPTTVAETAPPAPPVQDLPPPPPEPVAPPPPPPPPVAKRPPPPPAGLLDNDMMTLAAGGGLALVAIAALIIMRRRRAAREMQAAFGDTQVG